MIFPVWIVHFHDVVWHHSFERREVICVVLYAVDFHSFFRLPFLGNMLEVSEQISELLGAAFTFL